jgi:hypothetical protein
VIWIGEVEVGYGSRSGKELEVLVFRMRRYGELFGLRKGAELSGFDKVASEMETIPYSFLVKLWVGLVCIMALREFERSGGLNGGEIDVFCACDLYRFRSRFGASSICCCLFRLDEGRVGMCELVGNG